MRLVLNNILIITILFIIATSNSFACDELVYKHEFQSSSTELILDTCKRFPDELRVYFKGEKLDNKKLKESVLSILNSSFLNNDPDKFLGENLAKSLTKFDITKWELGKYDKIFCIDKSKSDIYCRDYILMRYRVRKNQNDFRLLLNKSSVQFN